MKIMLSISRIKVLLLKLVKATIFINNKVMTQEDKNLLLKDLCARLPHGVKVQVFNYGIEAVETLYEIDLDGYISTIEGDTLKYSYKPYLFPLSSMTEEQKDIFGKLWWNTHGVYMAMHAIDYLNKKHFDYRGLIEKGLAIDATGLNIY